MPAASAMSRTVVFLKPLLGEQPGRDLQQLGAAGVGADGFAVIVHPQACWLLTATTSPVMYDE